MHNVSAGQLILLVASIVCFAGSAIAAILRVWREGDQLRLAGKGLAYLGVLTALGVLLWHSRERGTWLPLGDNFDTLVCLGVLLATFVIYMQLLRPLRGIDSFLLPMVVLLLCAAGILGPTKPHDYVNTTWSWVHRIAAYGGAVAFAIAAASGLMFLLVSRRLKQGLRGGPGPRLGSLERLEHMTLVSVGLGFGLLTIGTVTGLARIAANDQTTLGDDWYFSPKVLMALGVWVIYAIVLHSPINPSFRGRRAAILSVVGFVLMIGTVVAVQFVPTGK